jgi:DNA-binding NarL/FixJ family response regulator
VVAQHVLAAGALGLVLKDQADGELAPAMRAAARGEQYISPRVADRLAAALRSSLTET